MSYAARLACVALLTFAAVVVSAGRADAFCRSTTCDPKKMACPRNKDDLCMTVGVPLYWPTTCLTMNVQENGSQKHDISPAVTQSILQKAFDAWTQVDCDGQGSPSIRVVFGEVVECSESEVNDSEKNANIVMYRDDHWPYPGSADAYALTRVHYGVDSGRIRDVDIEINGADEPLSVDTPVTAADLQSILTHEVGHLLGLDHTRDETATMFSTYLMGDDSLRTLAPDDEQAVCALYPPRRAAETDSCEPYNGFSPLCGDQQPPSDEPSTPDDESDEPVSSCAFTPGVGGSAGTALSASFLGVALFRRGRRHWPGARALRRL